MRQPIIVRSLEIVASPTTIYGFITDLSRWDRFIVETHVLTRAVPGALALGTTFRANDRNGLWRWHTTNTVLQAVPPRSLAFEVRSFGRPVATWRYDIVPTARGSRVTVSTRDLRSRTMCVVSAAATGVIDHAARNQRNIERTLTRLKAEAEKTA